MKYVKGPYEIKLYYCIKKQDPKRKIGFLIFYLPHFSLKKFLDPFISQKKNSSDYRLHGTQNDRLELTVSTQKSVLKNICQNLGRQTKPAYFETFWPISQDSVHIFQNRFFRWNREAESVSLNTINPIIRTIFLHLERGQRHFEGHQRESFQMSSTW